MEPSFSNQEIQVLNAYLKKLTVSQRKTKEPFVIGLIGIVGSGKRMVAEMLAHEIGGVVVSADELRTALRREKVGYKNIRELSLSIGAKIVEQGGNIIINSDFIDPKKREKLNAIGKAHDVSTLYVQVVCDPDVLFGRIIEEKYGTPTSDLFAGAKSIWKGKKKGAVVKFREMWRRTPHHYTWSEEGGGQWKIKNVQNVLGIIDTTDEKKIQKQVKLLIKKLK